jgi:hypothetical protein
MKLMKAVYEMKPGFPGLTPEQKAGAPKRPG